MFQPKWFAPDGEHSLIAPTGTPEPHLFFDLTPEFTPDNRNVNLVITTPEASHHSYRLDPVSGQRYYSFSYCPDDRPEFSIGHIPRMLDQLGTPQKVLLFGSANRIRSAMTYNYFRVRLVGAYVEHVCPEGNCENRKNILSRLVFIAVDPEDSRYSKVKEVWNFVRKEDWPDIKARLQKMEGKNQMSGRSYDYITVSDPMSFESSFEFFKKHSIYMSDKEMVKIKGGCHALYDRLWTEVGVEREEDKLATTALALKNKLKLREELKEKRLPVGFAARLKIFTKKYFDEITTCSKFVYAGNVNKNPEKFWFLSHMNLFFLLHKEGYFFDCGSQSWQRNLINTFGNKVYDIKNGIDWCDEEDFDLAMAYLPSYLDSIKRDAPEYFRFVDYDNHVFGSHAKLYSWVRSPAKKFECKGDQNETIRKELPTFPEEVKWKNRKVGDIEEKMKVIY